MSDEFQDEEFQDTGNVDDNPLKEGEPTVQIHLASKAIDVRYYENMTIQSALNQVRGKPKGDKFRLLLDGAVASLDTVVPSANTEIIFVGEWDLGKNKKKVN